MTNFIVYLTTNSIIIFILFSYLKDKYEAKYNKKTYFLIYCIYVFGISAINLFNIPILNLVCNILCFIFCDFAGYKHANFIDYCKDIIYFFLLIFLDTIAFFIVGLLYPYSEEMHIFRTLSASLIVLLCDMIVRRYISFTEIEYVPFKEIIIYLIITIFYIFIIYILSESYDLLKNKLSKGIIIFLVIGQILIDIIIYYYLNFVGLSYKMEKEVINAHQQLEMKRIYYTKIKKNYEENRKIIHDFKNYIQTLEDAYKKNSTVSDNLKKQLYNKLDANKIKYQTSSEILDIILMDKENEAHKENIEFIFKTEVLDISFISEIDIITIFGNLYDNAIEANKEYDKVKYIKTAIYKMGEMLIIRMENSCVNKLEYTGNIIKTTKRNHHGLGIKNIYQTVAKYNGIYDIKIDHNNCVSIITIPIK